MSCFWHLDLPTSAFLLCHYWSRTPLRRSGCKKTLQTMHKILYLKVQQRKAIQLLEKWRGEWYNQSIPMVTAGEIISFYLWLSFNLELNEIKLAVQTPFLIRWWWSESSSSRSTNESHRRSHSGWWERRPAECSGAQVSGLNISFKRPPLPVW